MGLLSEGWPSDPFSWFQRRSITTAVTAMASTSAMGAAQKMPVTPQTMGAAMENTISSTSRRMDSGAAAFAWPMDCRKMAHTFWTQVNRIKDK